MLESNFRFHRRSYTRKKTKEEKELEIANLPKNIGPYEIIEKLKDGGYSKIYKAKSCYTGDFVAIKAINKLCFQDTVEDVLLMIRQTEVLKILKHRNIISLYQIFESTKYFYLIMDYLPNGDLIEKIIKQKRFKEEEALNIFSQLVDALYYMHKNDICHRDIRTEKILFDQNNKPKLVGFSYSSFYTQGKKIRDNYGSLCYACPEIIQNEFYNPELADVWSLGVVLYVMICGYLPFSEDDDDKNKELIINGEFDFPPEISNKVKDLIKHMLDINPNKRYNFQRIIKHPWFKPYNENSLTCGVNIYKMIYPIDERILKIIVIYGFNKKEIDMDLKQNKFNNGTGLYKQLVDKFLGMGFKSYSDLCSEDFIEFKKDKENIITDGDIKYKKYITKILDKIKKVERYVNEYKRKEDKVIRDLESIYADAEAEEIKIKQKEKEKQFLKKNTICEINNPKVYHRRTLSPMLTVKEQKGIKDYLASKIGYIKKNKNSDNNNIKTINKNSLKQNDDFDFLKEFDQNNKINEINNFLTFNEEDLEFNEKKLKKCPSNPNIKEYVKKLLDKADYYNRISSKNLDISNFDIEKIPKRKRQLSVMIKKRKKNYLNNSSKNDSFLRRPKNEKERKKIIKDNLINSINQVIIEENINEGNFEQINEINEESNKDNNDNIENNNNNENNNIFPNINNINNENTPNNDNNDNNEDDKEIKNGETKKSKNIRYSLSFGDEDEELDESGFISKIESKQVSMYDIDEELKELKEIKNTLKSPMCGPYLKQNANDNKLFNFNIDNNSTIFGEHLDDNNIANNTNTTTLDNINEKIDILTQLKKLSEKNSTEVAKSKYDEEKKIIENNQFQDDSFGQPQNYKKELKPIIFNDKLEISFHDENSKNKDINNGSNRNLILYNSINNTNPNWGFNNSTNGNFYKEDMICFYQDKKTIKKLIKQNKKEEYMLGVTYIDLKRQNKYCYNFIKDLGVIKKIKINILNEDLNINNIELKRKNNLKKIKNESYNEINQKKAYTNCNSPTRMMRGRTSKNVDKFINKEKEIINKKIIKAKNKLKNIDKKKKMVLNKDDILVNSMNYSIEKQHNLSLSMNTNFINDTQTNIINSNMNTIDKSEMINPLINSQENQDNFINCCFNNNDNDNNKPKVYIIDNIDNLDSSNYNDSQNNNSNPNNNIIINSNNNTINNISINNKNNYGNYYEQNTITNNNYYNNENIRNKNNNNKYNNKKTTHTNNKNNINNINKLDWSKLTNKFKNESKKKDIHLNLSTNKDNNKIISRNEDKSLFLLNTYKNNEKSKSNKKNDNISNINNISLTNSTLTYKNKKDINTKESDKTLNLSSKNNINMNMNTIKKKKKNTHISVEKALHSNLMSNDYENIEDKKELISKVKKGRKIYQFVVNDKSDIKKNNNYYNKYVNNIDNKKKSNNDKKIKTNYVEQYHKKINSNINNNNNNNYNNLYYINKKEIEDNKDKDRNKHNKNRSDLVNYDYVFSIYNELNKNKNNDNIMNTISTTKKFRPKHQSMDFLQNSKKEEEINFRKNEFDDNFFFTNKKHNLRYKNTNDFSSIEKNE